MIWYRVDTNKKVEITPIKILRSTNTLIRFICRFSGEEIQEYKASKNVNWFESEKKAKEYAVAYLRNKIIKTKDSIKSLNEFMKEKEQELTDLEK